MKVALLITAALGLSVAYGAIDASAAAAIARAHANVGALPENALYVGLDTDDGRVVYEVRFHDATTRYEYEVDVESGAVLKAERKALPGKVAPSPVVVTPAPTPQPVVAPQPAVTDIGLDRAKAIALADAKVDPNTRIRKWKLDTEHGRTVYELEFRIGRMEYDYEIDASTGAILKREIDRDDDWF